MKLSKSDALLVHSTIFSYVNSNENITEEDFTELSSLRDRIHEFVTGEDDSDHEDCNHCEESRESQHQYDDEDEEDHDDGSDDEDEDVIIHDHVSCQEAADLSPISVFSPNGSKMSLEFEDVGAGTTVDALLDDGTVIIDSISCITLTNQNIALYDGEEWHDFKLKKSPKSWTKVFPHGKTVGFDSGEDE
jgi:hypothetical protein